MVNCAGRSGLPGRPVAFPVNLLMHLLQRSFRMVVVALATLVALCRTASAHDPGLSSAELTIRDQDIAVVLTFSDRDIAALSIPAGWLEAFAQRAATIDSGAGEEGPLSAAARQSENNVVFDLTFRRASRADRITFHSAFLRALPFGHRQVFVARDADGAEIARTILSTRDDATVVTLASPVHHDETRGTFLDFLLLGVRHIWTGYDHLLFLFALLLVCRTFRDAAVVISFFTVAHSLTLALATFDVVQLSSRIVEPAIALSIVYVGAENLLRRGREIRGRGLLTFAFGLVHGLGFAAVLRELGVAASRAAVMPLFSFNTGVELGQLAVASVAWPLISMLRQRTTIWPRLGVPVCSALIVLAGGYWLVERTILSAG